MRKIYLTLLILLPMAALAQSSAESDTRNECSALFCNPLRESIWGDVKTIQDAIPVLLDLFISLMMPIVALAIIFTGYTFATAKGDSAKIKNARTMLTYVVVGTMIILAAKGIAMAIQSTISTVAGPGTIVGAQ
ncbi:MAG TPA: hypothetical protein VJ579_00910 [Candidatus Paceibacterota bacterium]|nr:hypothetical protein [Candidatus Paceibacterota bacterium]